MVVQTTPRTIKMVFQKIPVKRIPAARKCAIALQAISRHQTITEIAKNFHCSRTTVHAQKNRALEAAANEFKDAVDDETLFTIAVTRSFRFCRNSERWSSKGDMISNAYLANE